MKKVIIIGSMSLAMSIIVIFGIWATTRKSVETSSAMNPVATINLSNGDRLQMELYPQYAPNTVANFITLAESGFYNHTYINRILPGYLIQAGDPIGNGYGFPGYFIKSECKYNGYKNKLKHLKGTVSMARGHEFDTEGSQFFILLKDAPDLNGQYAAFGRIIEGLEGVEKIGSMGVNVDYTPVKEIWIETIEVEKHGKNYAEPCVISIEEQRAGDV